MDTATEALFRAMLSQGWLTDTDGDASEYYQAFGWTTIEPAEVPEILEAFADVSDVYGVPALDDIVGAFVVILTDQGFVHLHRTADGDAARRAFTGLMDDYTRFLGFDA